MTDQYPIDPGPNHETIFDFDGAGMVSRTRPKPGRAVRLPGRIGRWTIHVPGMTGPAASDDDPPDVWVGFPGIIGPGQFRIHRSFESLDQLQAATPEISKFVVQAQQLDPGRPHLVLTTSHSGALDPARLKSVVDNLGLANVRATIIVDHQSTPCG